MLNTRRERKLYMEKLRGNKKNIGILKINLVWLPVLFLLQFFQRFHFTNKFSKSFPKRQREEQAAEGDGNSLFNFYQKFIKFSCLSPRFFPLHKKIYSALIRCTLLCHRTKYRRHMVWKIDREKSSFEMNKNWKFLVLNSNCFSHIVVLCCRTRIYMRLFFTN